MNDSPLIWLTGLNAALATFNGVFLSWLAYRNHQVSKNQLKLALYDRRFKVYEAVKQLLVDATKTDSLSTDGVAAYLRGTTEARFLFDPPAVAFMDSIRKKALAWRQQIQEAEAHAPGTAARAEAETQARKIKETLVDDWPALAKTFQTTLGFVHFG
ncbi:MAG: hypothetical protein ACO1TE_12020 [Prosthecobacter sp.]